MKQVDTMIFSLNTTWRKLTANTMLSTMLVMNSLNNPAMADAFQDGRATGVGASSTITNNISSGSGVGSLPTFGGTGPSNLESFYPGGGRDNPTSISNLMTEGNQVQDQMCANGDSACNARSFITDRYGMGGSGQYRSVAQTMSSKAAGLNPEDLLGLDNVPTEGGDTVCVETSTTLPDSTEVKQCLQSTMQQTTYFSRLPTTVGKKYTNPVCLNTSYTLSSDKSTCSKTLYSCPKGATLNGTKCTEKYKAVGSRSDKFVCSDVASSALGYKGSRNTAYMKCENNKLYYSARGAGSDGGGIAVGDFWHEMDLSRTYSHSKGLVPVAGDWSGKQRQGSSSLKGSCTNGQCKFSPRIGRSGTTWAASVKGCATGNVLTGWDDWGEPYHYCIDGPIIPKCPSGFALENQPYNDPDKGAGASAHASSFYWRGPICGKKGYPLPAPDNRYSPAEFKFPDPRKITYSCPNGGILNKSTKQCVITYPATKTLKKAKPGCLGGQVTSAGQVIVSKPRYEQDARTTKTGDYICVSDTYSCPAGMAMNGSLCEDRNRAQYIANPKCTNLGYKPENDTEGFLCVTQELDECSEIPPDCTETGSQCIYTDDIPGSPTYGQCIATEKTFECPVTGETIVSQNCSYQPMCFNGNCFEQEQKCQPLSGANPVQTYNEVCQNMTREDIKSCPAVKKYGPPDENGERQVIGGTPGSSCAWVSDATCTMASYTIQTDQDGNAYWPDSIHFSCLGDTLELCKDLDDDSQCTLTSTKNEQYSIDGGTPIVVSKNYSCSRTINAPGDTCTEDFARMAVAMEASRQGGNYLDPDDIKIFGGEFHRCDRRAVGFLGANLGNKSCCNISAPDPQSNRDLLEDAKQKIMLDGALALVDYSIDSGSEYVYDFMMDNEFYQSISSKLLGNAVEASNVASQADMLAEQTADFGNAYGVSYAGVGISYTGTQVVAGTTTTTSGMLGNTYSYGLGGGFEISFTPASFYVFAAMQLYAMYQAALACDEDDYKTATLSKGKLCYSYGSWCEREDCGLFGCTCTKYRTGKCCYNSKLARIINQQGREQLGLPMNDCDGFTVEQIEQLDWSKIDLSEFIADMLTEAQKNLPSQSDLQKLNDKIINNISTSTTTGYQPIDNSSGSGAKVHH